MKKVEDVMNTNVKACQPESNLAEVAGCMWDNGCGVLPVVDSENKVVGMITDRDICIALATRGQLASEVKVNEVATGLIFSTKPGDDIREAMEAMRTARVHRLPVVTSDNTLVGILSLNDIARQAQEDAIAKAGDITYKDVAVTLKAICQPPKAEVKVATI